MLQEICWNGAVALDATQAHKTSWQDQLQLRAPAVSFAVLWNLAQSSTAGARTDKWARGFSGADEAQHGPPNQLALRLSRGARLPVGNGEHHQSSQSGPSSPGLRLFDCHYGIHTGGPTC